MGGVMGSLQGGDVGNDPNQGWEPSVKRVAVSVSLGDLKLIFRAPSDMGVMSGVMGSLQGGDVGNDPNLGFVRYPSGNF